MTSDRTELRPSLAREREAAPRTLAAASPAAPAVDPTSWMEAGADAHSGWLLYELERSHTSKHAKEWADCEVPVCVSRLATGRSLQDTADPVAPKGGITVLPPASWAEGAADLLERALYLRSMSSEDARPVEAAITDHLNHSMRGLAPAPQPEPLRAALERETSDLPETVSAMLDSAMSEGDAVAHAWAFVERLHRIRSFLQASPQPEVPRR